MTDGAPVAVFCPTVSRESAYVPLLFTGTADRYRPVYREEATLDDALAARAAGREIVTHVHWEEFVLRACASDAQAAEVARTFVRQLAALRERGVPIVWTIHNAIPHEIGFRSAFLGLRAALADAADAILVHNTASIAVLAAQVALDRTKVRLLPHPSYLDRLEDEASLQAGLAMPHGRTIQGVGWIRVQKGFGAMIAMLPAPFLAERGLTIRISGSGAAAAAEIARTTARPDVVWDVRHVPDAELPRVLRAALCVALPYDDVLTSGTALLAMSVGALVVAVDIPQLRELVSAENGSLLFARGDGAALRRAIDAADGLAPEARRAIVEDNLARARALHPTIVSVRLAAVYDEVRARARVIVA